MKRVVVLGVLTLLTLFSCQLKAEQVDREWSGDWLVDFTHPDLGKVRFILTIQMRDSTFEAHTRKGADKIILGRWTSFLGRAFTPSFKEGKLITIEEGVLTRNDEGMELRGIFRSPLGNYHFLGSLANGTLRATLQTRNKNVKGEMMGIKRMESGPLTNYAAVFTSITATTEQYIYQKSSMESREWRLFKKNMQALLPQVYDDLELVFAFYYYAQKLPFSHYALIGGVGQPLLSTGEKEAQVTFTPKGEGIGVLDIRSFSGSVTEMEQAFQEVTKHHVTQLIVDLRDNSGGSIEAGLAFVNHVAFDAYDGGVFLTRKWFDLQADLPTAQQRKQFPIVDDANVDVFMAGIHQYQGVSLRTVPSQANRFEGELYLVVNGKTASTCEPIVYGLQRENRAVVVGEKTAGAMLNSERFYLDAGFTLILPTADFYTAEGTRIDQVGVSPSFSTSSQEAMDYVLEQLIKKGVNPK